VKYITELPIKRWKEYKNFYINAIKNEPLAFSDSLEEVLSIKDKEWKNRIQSALDKKSILLFVEYDGEIIGMVAGSFHKREKFKHNAFLSSLYVDKRFRGQGIGEKLIKKLIKIIRSVKGIKNIFCEIIETQFASIKLHEKMGFKKIGIFNDFIHVGNKYYSEIYFWKKMS
jgi:L-amino acid N-acyltransferase YncA